MISGNCTASKHENGDAARGNELPPKIPTEFPGSRGGQTAENGVAVHFYVNETYNQCHDNQEDDHVGGPALTQRPTAGSGELEPVLHRQSKHGDSERCLSRMSFVTKPASLVAPQ